MATKLLPLRTKWADALDRAAPLPEYPRPQLRRERWQSLNGVWQCAIVPREAPRPERFDREIVVPFAVESALSEVERAVTPEEQLWYRREFEAPPLRDGERLRLHFGAVDWEAQVWINGAPVGTHRGGFDPFHFDVTDALRSDGPQELVVSVHDPGDSGPQPVGKQALRPIVIQYTAVTGIWQTVWLEPVSRACLESVVAHARLVEETVTLRVRTSGARAGDEIAVVVREEDAVRTRERVPVTGDETTLSLDLPGLCAWSPQDPFLYDLELSLLRDDSPIDHAASYFAAREVATGPDENGVQRLWLNGAPVFHLGPLDQGWWPDGLYTAPTDEALVFDIEATKQMGFNTIRKHVKVEPARWYWHADRLGMLVWQDMPNPPFDLRWFLREAAKGKPVETLDYPLALPEEAAAIYRREIDAMIDALEGFACIVVWVPFNEAWGQHDTDAVLAHVATRDPSRVVDGPSGWVDSGSGALRDFHVYGKEAELPPREATRPIVYGEFGGLKLAVEGHMAVEEGWGYEQTDDEASFAARYSELFELIASLVPRGLAAAIYTQTTDVEGELNGLLSYDRAVFKAPPEALAALHRKVIASG